MELFRTALALLISVLLAYVIGSINFAIIITHLFEQKDIRNYGSGNAGMTNVLRVVGKHAAVLTTIGDYCKGVAAILLGRLIVSLIVGDVPFWSDYLFTLGALLGHCYPVFYGFKGGKGILVSAGFITVMNPWVFVIILGTFLLVVALSRIVSLSSISAAVMFPIATLLLGLLGKTPHVWLDFLWAVVCAVIVIWLHRTNIKTLLSGTEHRFGQKQE